MTKKYDNYEVLGLDIGNKTCIGVSQYYYEKPIIFDSRITRTKPLLTDCNEIIIDGEKYYVGEGKLDSEYRKVDKKSYLIFLYTLIALTSKSEVNKIVLGLPIGQVQEDENELINMILANSKKTITINGNTRNIIITDVEVRPEGACTEDDDFDGIIIDIGAGTTDACIIQTVRNIRKIKKPLSIPRGINTFYEEFINNLNDQHTKLGTYFESDEAEEILNNGYFEWDTVRYDVDSDLYNNEFAEDIISKLKASKYPLKSKPVSMTGGGAEGLFEAFKNIIGRNTLLQEEAIYANARNFYTIGVNLFRR